MDTLLHEQPAHIILFRRVAADNAGLLAGVLDVSPLPEPSARATRTVLGTANGVHARVYRSLGVAVATLTPGEITRLRSLDGVVAVLPNEERHLPGDAQGEARPGIQIEPEEDRDTPDGEAPAEDTLAQLGLSRGPGVPTGRGVKVAVLDTGVDLAHPDLTVLPGNAVSFVASEPDAHDGHGHGTHCAGVVAGRARPAGGRRYGVAPEVTLLVAKVLGSDGRGTDDQIIDAIDWATDQGAEILSMSLGSARPAGSPPSVRYEVIARRLLDQGVLLVAAAGNESLRPEVVAPVGNPAACASVLAVGAVDGRGRVARFSCGDVDGLGAVDVVAPGVGVLSAWPGGGTRRLSGTSMATPHVAGLAALHAQAGAGLTGRALWDRLIASARPVPGLAVSDGGAGVAQAPQPDEAPPGSA
ncbi:S8 family serine peptidase [Deinococcus petrolearius]|uniref:S8 family serine peptidase n=1 Tax=Deinococcus petrolearius TaxID=1751295 RepID=A0ABW1DG18_9DEIO